MAFQGTQRPSIRDNVYFTAYPWLPRVVSDVPDFDASFFPHLAFHRILVGFSWLDEACQSGVEFRREPFLRELLVCV